MIGKRITTAILTGLLTALLLVYPQGQLVKASGQDNVKAVSKVGEGLNTTVFETPNGKLSVNMPEDMEAGDTITGTVLAEATGNTPEEQAKNQDELSGYVVEVKKAVQAPPAPAVATNASGAMPPTAPALTKKGSNKPPTVSPTAGRSPVPFTCLLPVAAAGIELLLLHNGTPVSTNPVSLPPSSSCIPLTAPPPRSSCTPPSSQAQATGNSNSTSPTNTAKPSKTSIPSKSGSIASATPTKSPSPAQSCILPRVGQCGHPLKITTPGNGYANNCGVTVGGKAAPILAASPRSVVAKSPGTVVGATNITFTKGNQVATGKFNNIAVKLSCTNTVVQKGETATVTVKVTGLTGLTQPVKVILENHTPNTVTMAGGNQQTIVINPQSGG